MPPRRYPLRQRQAPGEWWKAEAIPTLTRTQRQERDQDYREPTPVISESEYEPPAAGAPPSEADDEESGDELDLIGDGHESELLAEANCLDSAMEHAVNSCLTYEYLDYEEACNFAFKHSGRFQHCFSVAESTQYGPEPKDWRDLKGRPDYEKWLQAAHEEILGLLENGTWTLEKLPPGRSSIGSRWVFKLKKRPDGSIERYKARLVGKGFSQRPGMDFDQTFSPTAKWASLRAILAIVALEDLECISVDISRAFLNGDMC